MTRSCVIIDDDSLSVRLLEGLIAQTEMLSFQRSFLNPMEAVTYLRENQVDILFLDYGMGEVDGMELLQALGGKSAIILVSGKSGFMIDSFRLNVVDCLLKPPSYAQFLKAVTKAISKLSQDQTMRFKGDIVFVKSDAALVKVDIRQIQWIEALADYVALVTKDKKYICHSTMKSIEARLPAEQFVRIHRSFIVRIDQIDAIEDKTVFVGDKVLPVGGTYRDSLMGKINLF
jgi:DNA-binding LytR/AlgR family response regulator